jgi:toxin ParE1/3/4
VSKIVRRPSANRDLVEIYRYYARQAGIRVADRFFAQAEATFARLARMPRIGTRYEPQEPRYADLRYFPVSRFRMYLVFYRPVRGGIEVLHVLHGARDIAGILAEEFGVEAAAGDEESETEGQSEE